ncbi:MAG: hypothetical protein K5644_01440, partial [Lachnospiraceae bacterium]|nr:hypothetical protein [Lachnospiraceae bacterium]
ARDFYHEHVEYRNEQIAVLDDNDEIMYMLSWEVNKITYPRLSKKVTLNLYVSDFWNYAIDSPRMDFDYIRDIDVFYFENVEEYSVAATKVILKHFPEKKIYYKDKMARLFFEDDVIIGEPEDLEKPGDDVATKNSGDDAATDRPEDKVVIKVGSEMIYHIDFGSYVIEKKEANSINLMSSLYWLSDNISYGERNPDKTFYIIKAPIASSGLVKFISFLIFFVSVAQRKEEMNVIPVLDTAIAGDNNQFNDGVYKNVWEMFFKPVSQYSLEEVYNSKNVIIGQEGKMGANPYLMHVEYYSNIGPLMKEYLVLNDEMEAYCKKVRDGLGIEKGAKVLGVIGRGSDFNNPGVARLHTLPLEPQGIVDKAREVYNGGDYDYIFLATEDQKVFDTFMASDLRDVTKFIEQKRYEIDAKKELLHTRYIAESKAGKRNGYEEAKVYISILEMLRRCDGMISSTDCGAVEYAMSMRGEEFDYLYIHGADSNEYLKNKLAQE